MRHSPQKLALMQPKRNWIQIGAVAVVAVFAGTTLASADGSWVLAAPYSYGEGGDSDSSAGWAYNPQAGTMEQVVSQIGDGFDATVFTRLGSAYFDATGDFEQFVVSIDLHAKGRVQASTWGGFADEKTKVSVQMEQWTGSSWRTFISWSPAKTWECKATTPPNDICINDVDEEVTWSASNEYTPSGLYRIMVKADSTAVGGSSVTDGATAASTFCNQFGTSWCPVPGGGFTLNSITVQGFPVLPVKPPSPNPLPTPVGDPQDLLDRLVSVPGTAS